MISDIERFKLIPLNVEFVKKMNKVFSFNFNRNVIQSIDEIEAFISFFL